MSKEKHNIRILCDQTDCIWNTTGWVSSDYMKHAGQKVYDSFCNNSDGVIISVRQGCQTKQTK